MQGYAETVSWLTFISSACGLPNVFVKGCSRSDLARLCLRESVLVSRSDRFPRMLISIASSMVRILNISGGVDVQEETSQLKSANLELRSQNDVAMAVN